ncbi:hypothetical protein ACEUA6_17955 [Aeromonas veronii]
MNRALPLLGLLLPLLAQAVTPDEAQLQQAVHEGRVRPFHEMMEVAARLPVRVLRVDLGEEDGIWLYELAGNCAGSYSFRIHGWQTINAIMLGFWR